MLKPIIFSDKPAFTDWSHTLLRIFFGLSLVNHGQDKLFNFSSYISDFPDPLGVGITLSLALVTFSEFFCGLLILFGLFTRVAAVFVVITFIVAVFIYQGAEPYQIKEIGVFYMVLGGYFLVSGAGKIAMDTKFFTTS